MCVIIIIKNTLFVVQIFCSHFGSFFCAIYILLNYSWKIDDRDGISQAYNENK